MAAAEELVEAARFGRVARIGELLAAGVPADGVDAMGTTPLYAAAVQGEAAAVRCLLAVGAAPDLESGHGDEGTPLCAAAAHGHAAVVRELLSAGASPDLREDRGTGRTPLEWALLDGNEETITLLRPAGPISR
jgi:uncharacterized protein